MRDGAFMRTSGSARFGSLVLVAAMKDSIARFSGFCANIVYNLALWADSQRKLSKKVEQDRGIDPLNHAARIRISGKSLV